MWVWFPSLFLLVKHRWTNAISDLRPRKRPLKPLGAWQAWNLNSNRAHNLSPAWDPIFQTHRGSQVS